MRLSPDPIGPRCFRGDMALCCRHDERWRCADVGTALRVRDVDASSLVISPAGEITFVDRFCDGGSELTECNRVRHFMHADGASLVSDGSISVGFGWDEHERDVGERGTSVHGETRDLLWEHEVRGHACVEVRGARLTTGTYSAFYPARGRPRRRQRTARPAPVYGERVDLLPRFAPSRHHGSAKAARSPTCAACSASRGAPGVGSIVARERRGGARMRPGLARPGGGHLAAQGVAPAPTSTSRLDHESILGELARIKGSPRGAFL
ncbi:MAG: hypothetical protein M5U09_17685 [Gammaproteobacteria bacterium]|nr:hypothetical protein [Gammaproteobacteria bacterium]